MTRFLVDAQLPPALGRMLRDRGHLAEHVHEVGLSGAPDTAIWAHAETHGATILTKDEDFAMIAGLRGTGPSVIWIRVGNTTNRALLQWFEPQLPMILLGLTKGERVIEVV